MILFIVSLIVFNSIVIVMKKQLTKNQIFHVWKFSMILEMVFDLFIDEKLNGYSYFDKGIDGINIIVYALLIPPVNIMILNGYLFYSRIPKKLIYLLGWLIFVIGYEYLALLPEPWGFFHYGWWKIYYSMILDPILLMILLGYFKWVTYIEKR
ncbi:hypothetical protein PU629_14075 [Pullulanibacillus sp. KACC 23026]|uniref:hypothetical protein n=1 Tax=Pullulanibacillus sp. KACC 23026 TaxID=3028315 RepID=UPI0023B15E22|nr:hypothetical protein [Pullulanibacillus sp. KACC 23026]WEG11288.1 hypothetical protein PU629_14075 [Pullulanibacillus sp. KACC 23026]